MAVPTGKPVMNIVDSRINYNLMPGEKLLTCPYNPSHGILEKKFSKHVLHCHRLHCKDQEEKGLKPLFSICKFDRAHHVKNEDLADHESECEEMRKKDDWDDWEDEGAAALPPPVKLNVEAPVEPRKLPEIDEESMKAICAEEWEVDPNAPGFDADHAVHVKRSQGYKIIRGYAVVGLTKSEKKEFYAKEKAAMDTYERNLFIARLKKENRSSGGASHSNSSGYRAPSISPLSMQTSCGKSSMGNFGYEDDLMLTIEEENDIKQERK